MVDVDKCIETCADHAELETYYEILTVGKSTEGVMRFVKSLDPIKDREMLEAIFVMTDVHGARVIALQKLTEG